MSEQNPDERIQTRLLARGVRPRKFDRWLRLLKPAGLQSWKRSCLFGLLAFCMVAGAIVPWVRESSHTGRLILFFFDLTAIGLTLLWCVFDSYQRGYQIKLPLGVCIVLLAFLGVPFYLLRTRGWYGFVSIVLMALFFVGCVVTAVIAAVVTCLIAGMPLS